MEIIPKYIILYKQLKNYIFPHKIIISLMVLYYYDNFHKQKNNIIIIINFMVYVILIYQLQNSNVSSYQSAYSQI